ncbi:hypothetical protein PHMEG_00016732 [Phytophthora megakarya]|uniref:Uncharacterized protein n=1 Tax=Phytophthora megakarya TaxID=4795 RepID=A0A225VZ54_9STRA|nr:hypothetical protein PHMEG_00016732 [Phytophthora megakarya]
MPVIAWVPIGQLPRDVGYWQVLAYVVARDNTLFKIECEMYEQWIASQPPMVDRPHYENPTEILTRTADEVNSQESIGENNGDSEYASWDHNEFYRSNIDSGETLSTRVTTDESSEKSSGEESSDEISSEQSTGDVLDNLECTFVSVIRVLTIEGNDEENDETSDTYIQKGADVELTGYAQELPFLPDLSENSPTVLDYSPPNVTNSKLTEQEQTNLIEMWKTHKRS